VAPGSYSRSYTDQNKKFLRKDQGVDNNVVITTSANVYTAGAERVLEEGEGGQGFQIIFHF